jgi:hypothetical protein
MMPYNYRLSGGCYSDFTEEWWTHDKQLTQQQFQAILADAYLIAKRRFAELENEKWDECERLFGVRRWPWQGKFIGLRNESKFEEWRDKYMIRLPDLIMEVAGFTGLVPDLDVYCGGYLYPDDAIMSFAKGHDEIKSRHDLEDD